MAASRESRSNWGAAASLLEVLLPVDTELGKADVRQWQAIYPRILAAILILLGLRRWAIIVGVAKTAGATSFTELGGGWQWATINLAIAYPAAAVGLWMFARWGLVVWIYGAGWEIAMHTIFAGTFGLELFPIGIQLSLIGIYLAAGLVDRRAEANLGEERRTSRSIPAGDRPVGAGRFTAAARGRLAVTLARRSRVTDSSNDVPGEKS